MIAAKLKGKVDYHVDYHVLFEPVRPNFVEIYLTFLKLFNYLYSNIEINVDNILEGLIGFGEERNYIEQIMTKNISQPIPIIV